MLFGVPNEMLAIIYSVADVTTIAARHLVAELVVAGAGVLLIPVVFLLARKVCSAKWALLPAALVAICPASVSLARIPAPDILLTLFAVLALWLIIELVGAQRQELLEGVAACLLE